MHLIQASRTAALLCALPLIALTVGCSQEIESSNTSEKATGAAVPVRVVAVSETKLAPTVSQPAVVQAWQEAAIRSRIDGYVDSLSVEIGDFINAGDVLLQLAIPELAKQHEVLQAREAAAKSQVVEAAAAVSLAEAQVMSALARKTQAESELAAAEAALAASDAELNRVRDLVQRQSLEPRLLDEAIKRRDSDRASLTASAAAIESAQADVTVAEAGRDASRAALKTSEAEAQVAARIREELETRQAFATLKAPFSGVVTERHVDVGDLVQAGTNDDSQPLLVLSEINRVRLRIAVPESQATQFSTGDQVAVQFPALPDGGIKAEISRMAYSLDGQTRTMLIEADYDNPDHQLLPGMFGQAVITSSQRIAALSLPARAIRFSEQGAARVFVIQPDQTVSEVAIETGFDDGRMVEIRSGVTAGQEVADVSLARLKDGQSVVRVIP